MAQLHVLLGDGNRNYTCVLHIPIAAGNNAVGMSFRAALVASGIGGTTQLATGLGGHQISATELAQIQAGEVYETSFSFQDEPGYSTAQRNAALDQQIAGIAAETQTRLAQQLRYFSHTRA